jgi:ankyrin repeat protein
VIGISFKTVKHVRRRPGWLGKQGKLLLSYQSDANNWKLTDIKADSFSELTRDGVYAVRKTAGYPLLVAVDEGDVERVKTLLDRGANVNERGMKGETALMMAAARGYVDVARVLVKSGADVAATCSAGLTALMSAASARQEEMVTFLLDNGADVNRKGPSGSTALLLAAEGRGGDLSVSDKGLVSIMSALVDKGANVNARDGRGLTVLWFALREGKEAVIKVLLDKGADVNMVAGKAGWTPLMEAVAMGRPSIVKILLEKGADVNAKKNGVTALNIAKASRTRANKKIELIQILNNAGAKE